MSDSDSDSEIPEKIVIVRTKNETIPPNHRTYVPEFNQAVLRYNSYKVSWEIDSSIQMISESFWFGQKDEHKAHLELFPVSFISGRPSTTIHFVSSTPVFDIGRGTVSITQMVGSETYDMGTHHFSSTPNQILTFYIDQVTAKSDGAYNSQPAVLETISKYKILCTIWLEEFTVTNTYDTHKNEMANSISNLYTSKSFSDVTIHVESQKIPAHRAILAARSPVFAAMFSTDMAEKGGVVNVEDISYKAMNDLIKYIYTGVVSMKKSAEDLLPAADKYGLTSLKFECGMYLARHNISVNNAVSLALLADRHQHEHLRKTAVKYFRKHKQEVMDTEMWKELKKSNPTLLLEILTK